MEKRGHAESIARPCRWHKLPWAGWQPWVYLTRFLGAADPQPVSCNQRIRFSIKTIFSSLSGVLSKAPNWKKSLPNLCFF